MVRRSPRLAPFCAMPSGESSPEAGLALLLVTQRPLARVHQVRSFVVTGWTSPDTTVTSRSWWTLFRPSLSGKWRLQIIGQLAQELTVGEKQVTSSFTSPPAELSPLMVRRPPCVTWLD